MNVLFFHGILIFMVMVEIVKPRDEMHHQSICNKRECPTYIDYMRKFLNTLPPIPDFIDNTGNVTGVWVHLLQLFVRSTLLIFSVFCIVYCFVCLCSVSCTPNVVCYSGFSTIDCPFGFLYRLSISRYKNHEFKYHRITHNLFEV